MPSRFMVSRAARAVGITVALPGFRVRAASAVAIASISGTTRSGCFLFDQRRSAAPSVMSITWVRCATCCAGAFVAVDGDDFDAEALQLDDHFLAELARAEQHDLGGGWGRSGVPNA